MRSRAHRLAWVLSTGSLIVGLGCGMNAVHEASSSKAAPSDSAGYYNLPAAVEDAPASPEKRFTVAKPGFETGKAGEGLGGGVANLPADSIRKIIYRANIDLVVEDFAGVPDKVVELVKKYDAYVADSNLSGTSGDSRHATWKIRVPVARFEDFVGSAKSLGELVSVHTASQDVSEEYYDVDARIRSKAKEEERLLKLLEERPGKLEDVIAIERELSRVREELERIQGRMRVLADLTSLTTVELSIREVHNYQPEDAPTLATRIGRTFGGSLGSLQAFGEAVVLLAVAMVPWLLSLGLVLPVVYWLLFKRLLASRPQNPAAGTP